MSMYTKAASVLALAATASAHYQGFNYASTNGDGSARATSDFEQYFTTAQNLVGTSGFTSARLYTMIQGDTTNDPISAIQAAINTNTTLLFGLWASGDGFQNEIAALQSTISTYGSAIGPLVAGISVGSEDLYRVSEMGIEADEGPGQNPDTIVDYISQVRKIIAGTPLSNAPVGHVDTWTSWVNSTNSPVVDACDFIGVDAYPYFQSTMANPIEDAKDLFDSAMQQVQAAAGSKDVWVTETGWPVSGQTYGQGVPSLDNAATYWQTVGCPLFGQANVWWYILDDMGASPSFGVISDTSSTTPLFNLACNSSAASVPPFSTPSSSSAVSSASSASGSQSSSPASTLSTTVSAPTGSSSSSSGSSSSSNPGSSNDGTSTTASTTTTPASVTKSAGAVKTASATVALLAFVAGLMAL